MTGTDQWPAVPVYNPRDYALILKLSEAGDLPPTWDEWWEKFRASEAEQRRRGSPAIRVRVHPGKFKAWLQDNSLSSSEQTRQQFAQQLLDRKRARNAQRLAGEISPATWTQAPVRPPHCMDMPVEVLAYVLLTIAIICSALVALKDGWHDWMVRQLLNWPPL